MESTILETAKSSAKNWWLSLIVGVLFIIVGIWIFRTPVASYMSLSLLFSISIFISGIFGIIFAISNRNRMEGWGWYLAGGILDLVVGILFVSHPLMTMTIIPFYVGFWVLFRGVLGIGLSFQLKHFGVPNWGWLLLFGILTLLFSFLLLMNPAFAILSIVYMTGIAFIVMGVFRMILAFELRRIHKYIKTF